MTGVPASEGPLPLAWLRDRLIVDEQHSPVEVIPVAIQLRGATVVVTRGSRGLGRMIALELAGRGAHVALAARSSEDLQVLKKEIEVGGGRAIAVPTDVTRAEDRERLVQAVEGDLGPIDVLVNNAGIERIGAFATHSDEDIAQLLAVDVQAPMLLTRRVLPGMLARGRGQVVNVSSVFGKGAGPWDSVYAGAKHALLGWSFSLRLELRGTGVGVSTVCPGLVVDDGMFANLATPDDLRQVRRAGVSTTSRKVARSVAKAIDRDAPEVVSAGPAGAVVDVIYAVSPRLGEETVAHSPAFAMGRQMAKRHGVA